MPYYNCNLSGGSKTTAIKIGSAAGTYDIAAVYSGYAELTADNFVVETNIRAYYITYGYDVEINSGGATASSRVSPCKKTYDASTGSLTISENNASVNFEGYTLGAAVANPSVTGIWLIIT